MSVLWTRTDWNTGMHDDGRTPKNGISEAGLLASSQQRGHTGQVRTVEVHALVAGFRQAHLM